MPRDHTHKPTCSRVRLAMALDAAADAEAAAGEYVVSAINAGEGNGLHYPPHVLQASLPLWEGVSVFVDHAGPEDWGRPGGRSIRDLAGVFHGVAWDAHPAAIRGRVRFLARARWLCDIIDECLAMQRARQPAPKVGLSADLEIERRGNEVTAIKQVYSLDVVMNPARGGGFEAAVLDQPERRQMAAQTADLLTAPTPDTPTMTSRVSLADEEAIAQVRREACAALLAAKLAASHLPDPWRAQLAARFADRVFAPQELEAELQRARALHAQLAADTTIKGLGAVQVGRDAVERLQLALERVLGVPLPDHASDIPRLSGFREFYLLATGDREMTGAFHPERVSLANLTTSSLSSIVKNALNKALLHAYEARPFWWRPIVWEEDFTSLNEVTWITAGGFADLPTVAEGADYTELANLTDIEETAAFLKKGAYAGITLEAIDRDDVALIRSIPRKLGLAAHRTLSSAISAIFTANGGVGPTLGQDAKALFHADHGNLGSDALDTTSWDAAVQAVYKQAEPASGKRLGLRLRYLIVPIELEVTALQMLASAEYTGGDTATLSRNPRYGAAEVIVCPDFTDAADWAAAADPADAPGICIGYRYGRQPELFISQDPLTGSMFTNDTMRLKVRFYYAVGVGEYRALYKANVA